MSIDLTPEHGLVEFIPVNILPVHTNQFSHNVKLQRPMVNVHVIETPFCIGLNIFIQLCLYIHIQYEQMR